jgi:fucose permease
VVTAIFYLLHFIFGFATGFVGAIMPSLIDAFGINMVQGSYVVGMINAAGIASVLLVFVFGDRVNKFIVVGAALALFSISLIFTAFAPAYGVVLVGFLVFGFGIKTFDTMNNAVMSDIHGHNRGLYLNIMHAAFSIGALSSPQFVFLVENNKQPWNAAFLLFGGGCAAALLLYVTVIIVSRSRLPVSAKANTIAAKDKSLKSIFVVIKSTKLWVLAMVFFSVFGVISITNTWLVYHLQKTVQSTQFLSKSAVTIFWIGVLLSRTALVPIAMRHGGLGFVRITAAVSAVVYAAALIVGNAFLILAAVLLSGLAAGQINPFVIADSCAIFPGRSASVNALLFLVAYVAQISFPWFSGLLGEQFGSVSTMMIVPTSFVLIFLFTIFVVNMKSNEEKVIDLAK